MNHSSSCYSGRRCNRADSIALYIPGRSTSPPALNLWTHQPAMMLPTTLTLLCILLSVNFVLGVEKQIQLEDIERDNLSSKKGQQQLQQKAQQQQQQQQQQPQAKPEQVSNVPAYTGQVDAFSHQPDQQLSYQDQQQQILLQQLQAYQQQPQVQYQAPPTASAVALYPAAFLAGSGIPGNHLGISGIPHDVGGIQAIQAAYIAPQHQSVPSAPSSAFPQQFYVPASYPGFQFVQASPQLLFTNQQVPPEPKFTQQPTQSLQVVQSKEFPSAPPAPKHQNLQTPSQIPRGSQANIQQPRIPTQLPPSPSESSFAYTPQQGYNPIPKELQSYTTIPETVYQGKEPDYLYDQQSSISLTNDQFNQYNALFQQPQIQSQVQSQIQTQIQPQVQQQVQPQVQQQVQPQVQQQVQPQVQQQVQPQVQTPVQSPRPIISSGVKTPSPPVKSFPGGGSFFTRNSFLNPTRHFPGSGLSYSSYRQGSGAF